MPANNFQPIACVPEVSLLDPYEIIRPDGAEKISFKSWKKQKVPVGSSRPREALPEVHNVNVPEECRISSNCGEDKLNELMGLLKQQSAEITRLSTENASLRTDVGELKQSLTMVTKRLDSLTSGSPAPEAPSLPSPHRSYSSHGRWSLPGNPSECVDESRLDESFQDRVAPDKSQMLNNLFRKYFPSPAENSSPSNKPILEYKDEDKSMATLNYMTKYKLLANDERILDISKLKKQTKLTH